MHLQGSECGWERALQRGGVGVSGEEGQVGSPLVSERA